MCGCSGRGQLLAHAAQGALRGALGNAPSFNSFDASNTIFGASGRALGWGYQGRGLRHDGAKLAGRTLWPA